MPAPRIAEVATVMRDARKAAKEEFGNDSQASVMHVLAVWVAYYRKKHGWDYKKGFPEE